MTADFVFSDGKISTEGVASISKSDYTNIVFLQPEALNGVSVKGDNTGNADVFSFEFSGIPASVPKSIASDLSLMFSLFSDAIPNKIESLDKSAFKLSQSTSDNGNALAEVFFTENGMSYTVTYDSKSGVPFSIDAGNDRISVSILLSDFKAVKQ